MGLKAARAKALNKEWANKTSSGMVQERTTVTRAILASGMVLGTTSCFIAQFGSRIVYLRLGRSWGRAKNSVTLLILVGPSTRGRLRGRAEG